VGAIIGGKFSGHRDYCQRLEEVRAMLKCESYEKGERNFSFPKRRDRLWGSSIFQFNIYPGSSPPREGGGAEEAAGV
jgi:hypothetical protein